MSFPADLKIDAINETVSGYVQPVAKGLRSIVNELLVEKKINDILPVEQDEKIAYIAAEIFKKFALILAVGAAIATFSMIFSLIKDVVIVGSVLALAATIHNYASDKENMEDLAKKYNAWWTPVLNTPEHAYHGVDMARRMNLEVNELNEAAAL